MFEKRKKHSSAETEALSVSSLDPMVAAYAFGLRIRT